MAIISLVPVIGNVTSGLSLNNSDDIGNISLNQLINVDAGSPANNQVIAYNSGTGNWEQADQLTGLSAVVDDTTPQLGGDLDINGSNITGSGVINIESNVTTAYANTHILIADMTGIGSGNTQNSIPGLTIGKTSAANNRRTLWPMVTYIESGGTDKYLTAVESRFDGTYKRFRFVSLEDAGLSTGSELSEFTRWRADSSGNNILDLNGEIRFRTSDTATTTITFEETGQISQTVDGAAVPGNFNMSATLPVADKVHNYLVSISDYETNAAPDGAQLTHAFKVYGSAGEQFVGRLAFEYSTTELNNQAELRSTDHSGFTQGQLGVNGKNAFCDLPIKPAEYAVASLPTVVAEGAIAYVNDESTVTSGKCLVFHDGTNWKLAHSPNTTAS